MMLAVPTFEPEVLKAAARRRGTDDAKIPTTALQHFTHRGVRLQSRWRKAAEIELLAQAVDMLSGHAVLMLRGLFYDTGSGGIGAKAACGQAGLDLIGRELRTALKALQGGHGDILLAGRAGAEAEFLEEWNSDAL